MLDTAIMLLLTVDVTAINSSSKSPMQAPVPSKDLSTKGMISPLSTCTVVGPPASTNTGKCSMARAVKLMTVPTPHGNAKIASDARSYAGTVE